MSSAKPIFRGERAKVQDETSGISITVVGTADYDDVTVLFSDPRFATTISLPTRLIRLPGEDATTGWPCGYDVDSLGVASFTEYLRKSGLTNEDVKIYLRDGLALIASNLMRVPKENAVIRTRVNLA